MIVAGDIVLARYRVVEQVASGGHSVVFRGLDERLSRPVCIKVFSGLGGTKSGLGRTTYDHFVQEAFSLSRLTHPNTLRIYDFGHLGDAKDADGMPVQVCEYMNGGTLTHVVRDEGPQSLAETARVIGAMCAALAEAHALGIVHRDIKPQNILFATVGASRLPKLADFGIAKWTADADPEDEPMRAEDTAIVAGQKLAMYSPSWAAPEQLAGQRVTGATDIYSLAVVAVYMLSGKAIFADDDVYAGYKKRRRADELVRRAFEQVSLPGGTIELLVRALAFDPKERPAKIEELAGGLDEVRAKATRAATPVGLDSFITTPLGANDLDEVTPPPREPPPAANAVSARAPTGPRRTLVVGDAPQAAGDRTVRFALVGPTHQADLSGPNATRIRVTLINGPSGLIIHCKGMSCFVALAGGRPSPAVNLERPGEVALVTPRAEEVARVRVATGTPDGAHLVFALGDAQVAVRTDECSDPILFDFGPGSDAYFVYTRGRTLARSPGR